MSYLLPFLRQATSEIGSDLNNALNALAPSDFADLRCALLYGHLCELVPFVRNGYLQVEKTEDGFRLRHPSAVFAYDEQRDIVATELSLTMVGSKAPYNVAALYRMVEQWPNVWGGDLITVLQSAYKHYLKDITEDSFVDEGEYLTAFSFEKHDFDRVRASMMAFASWCIGMSVASDAKSQQAMAGQEDKWREECLEWAVPLLKRSFVIGVIQGLSGVVSQRVGEVLSFFVDDPLGGHRVSGDGYLAPFLELNDSYLVSPRSILNMTVERNLLFVLNRRDRRQFDNVVSAHLEPALLARAEAALKAVPGLRVRKNIVWRGGELDLLAYDEASKTALQLQAKAAIPAQGARMTRQLEAHTLRAIEQISIFEQADISERETILERSFGVDPKGTRWASAVLTRSSFGTSRGWASLSHRGALNLAVLRKVLKDLQREGSLDLTRIPELANRVFAEVIQISSDGWEEGSLDLFGTEILFPNLKLDVRAVARAVIKG